MNLRWRAIPGSGLAVLGVAAWSVVAPPARADLPALIDQIKPSIVAIGSYKATNNPPFSIRGTGFVVRNGTLVATNAHVVGAIAGEGDGVAIVAQVSSGASGESQRRGIRVIAVDRSHDLAVLELDGPPLPALPLGRSDAVREGQAVAFTGFPIGAVLGFYPATHRGIVSAISPIVLPTPTARSLNEQVIKRIKTGAFKIFQLDATAYPGNSGSPVFDATTGEVLGIINMVFVKGSKEAALTQPSGITYAIPAEHLQALLPERSR